MEYLAHIDASREPEISQGLRDHLLATAKLASGFADKFDAGSWAWVLGLAHDAGKASAAFQRRLHGSGEHVDHSTAGAQLLAKRYGLIGRQLAYLVAGHHGGIPNGVDPGARTSLKERLGKMVEPYDDYFDIVELPSEERFRDATPDFLRRSPSAERYAFSFAFLLKMLFSTLVDADYLDTERFFDAERSRKRVYAGKTLAEMKRFLDAHMATLEAGCADGEASDVNRVNRARADIRAACVEAAGRGNGLFTLTVPTGGGKTLSMLSFALAHAIANGQERIIYLAPYTTIIDQTARVLKGIFGENSVLPHHSSYDPPEDGPEGYEQAMRERLAMENWDAPLIITTNVQFFESLFAVKTSRCRKVHRIANSVVLLDEAQVLPDRLLKPSLAVLEELCAHYGASAVFCTATQPALDTHWPFGSKPVDIVPASRRHMDVFEKRVEITNIGECSLDGLVDELAGHHQVLCVVSSRKAAGVLFDSLQGCLEAGDGLYHLSALMVPEHRVERLREIQAALRDGRRCVVVSTQLVEAGVDIDFPVVYREVAGIDSIKQAAGRCNREGRRPMGQVRVFECPDLVSSRKGWLAAMRSLGKETIALSEDPFGDGGVRDFFVKRYQFADTDGTGIFAELSDFHRLADCNCSFERYADDYKFIEDDSASVFVPWGEEGRALHARLASGDYDVSLMRKLQGYTVGVPRRALEDMERAGRITVYGPFKTLEPQAGQLIGYSGEKGLIIKEVDMTLTI